MDIYDLLFYQILKFDYSTSVLTGDFGNDILYGLLIPGILIFMVISEFTSVFAGSHSKMKHLITIAALGVIIQSGWYATIAGFSGVYFPLAIIFFVIMFFKRKLIARNQEGAGMGLFGKLLGALGVGGHMKDALGKMKPKRSESEVNVAIARIISFGTRFDTVRNQAPGSVQFVQSNADQIMRMLIEEANGQLDPFNKDQKIYILTKVLMQRDPKNTDLKTTTEPFLAMLIPLVGII